MLGHGGTLWPPSWQDGQQIHLEKIMPYDVPYDPAYVKGHGKEYLGKWAVTNPSCTTGNPCSTDKTHCPFLLEVAV